MKLCDECRQPAPRYRYGDRELCGPCIIRLREEERQRYRLPEDTFRLFTARLGEDEVQRVLESVLTPRERLVLQLRFGLGNSQAHPRKQVGRELGLTDERVRQIEAASLTKLYQHMGGREPSDEQIQSSEA